MALFKDMLHSDETLFKNEEALNYDFVPRMLPHREMQQKQVAACIKPLFNDRAGKNCFVSGAPGIGKTAALKWVLRDLEDDTDDIKPFYINCWQKNTTYKVMLALCDQLGYKFTQNKNTEDLFKVVKDLLIAKGAVFVFDEVDKLDDFDFLYSILEEVQLKTVVLITNFKEWLMDLDERIKSRLMCEVLHFDPYNAQEGLEILQERVKYAFFPQVWGEEALEKVAEKTYAKKDIRTGIYLLKESGRMAEDESSRKISEEHVEKAVVKLDEFTVKKKDDLELESQKVLEVVKEHSGGKAGDLYKKFQSNEGMGSYKTFMRRVEKLEKAGFVVVKRTSGGVEGNTSFISVKEEKKITDY
jgi:cell division control protein 6